MATFPAWHNTKVIPVDCFANTVSKDVKITASLNSNVFYCLLFSISERKNVGSNEAAALKEIGNILWGRMC